MVWTPHLCRVPREGGGIRYSLGHELVDAFLEFAWGRSRPNTVRAYAHDLKVFFSVVAKDPVEVTPADVMAFVSAQHRPRPGAENVVHLRDAGSGLSAATVMRRLAAVSAFYGYLLTRGDTAVVVNPVPRGLPARRNRRELRGAPLVRGVRRLPRILDPAEAAALLSALRTHRDRAIVEAMLLGGLRRNEALGLRLEDLRLGECRVFVAEGKGGHQRLVPMSPTFFTTAGGLLGVRAAPRRCDRPPLRRLEGPAPRRAALVRRPRRDHLGRTQTGGPGAWDLSRAPPHLPHPFTRGGHVARSAPGPGRTPLHRVDPGLLAPRRRLAGGRVPRGGRGARVPARPRGPRMSGARASNMVVLRTSGHNNLAVVEPARPGRAATWPDIAARAPQLASTMAKYLAQIAVSSRPGTVEAADLALRVFAGHLVDVDPPCVRVADVARDHIESFKLALAARPGRRGQASVGTIRHKLGLVRTFFERIIEWEYPDAPRRVPIFAGDFPKADEPLPRFLDDPVAAKFMAALAVDPNRRRRLMVELLARTGMRAGELGALRDDAVFRLSGTHWLRIPVGKLHNDRNVPLHPVLVELIEDYRAQRGPSPSGLLVVRRRRGALRPPDHPPLRGRGGPAGRHRTRPSPPAAPHARHPAAQPGHEPRGHRGPARTSLAAHDSRLRPHLQRHASPSSTSPPLRWSRRLRGHPRSTTRPGCYAHEHQRLLGNGRCVRPAQLDCSYQTICEGCGFFETGPEFLPILRRQRQSASQQADFERQRVYQELIDGLTTDKPLGVNNRPGLSVRPHRDRG